MKDGISSIDRRYFARRYGLAIVASGVAFLIALPLQRPLIELSPFLLFYATVTLSSWDGGFGPGLLAIGIGGLVVDYWLFMPFHTFRMVRASDVGQLLLFLLVGILIAWLNDRLRRAKEMCEVRACAARMSEVRAKRLSEANLIAVFFSDVRGNLLSGNDEFLRLAGCTREEMQAGRVNWREITAPEHRALDAKAIEELKRSRVCTPFEKEHLLHDGRRIPVLAGCAMLDAPSDECVGFLLDLTERKRVESDLRDHRSRLAALTVELMVAEEHERQRIARVVHDSIGQNLALAKLRLGAVACRDGDTERIKAVAELIDQVIGRARSLTSEISPPVLYELGLEAAVRWLGVRVNEQHGIQVEIIDDRQPKPLHAVVRRVLFEAVRELLINVAKHATARECTVTMGRSDETIRIEVQDNGQGFEPIAAEFCGERFGLSNLRARLDQLGGCIEIQAQRGKGTSAIVIAPLSSEDN